MGEGYPTDLFHNSRIVWKKSLQGSKTVMQMCGLEHPELRVSSLSALRT